MLTVVSWRLRKMLRSLVARRAGAVLGTVFAAVAMLPAPVLAAPGPAQFNATDTILLNGVRQAGLWEMPAGQMASQKGTTVRIRQVGQMIADQHAQLDELVVKAANQIGAEIPATPTAEQQGFLAQMENAEGRQFDQTFVTLLRKAHGKIFPVIGAVRASTRNPAVRDLADQTTIFVMNHMNMLESTGLVRYQELPPAALAAQDTSTLAIAGANAAVAPPVSYLQLWVLLIGMVAIGGMASFRLFRTKQ
jgi:predicted outer membrane protein